MPLGKISNILEYKVNVPVNQQNSFDTLRFSPKTVQSYPARMIQHFWKQLTQSISSGMSFLGGYFDFDWKVLVQCHPLPLECWGLHQRGQLSSVLSPLASAESPHSLCISLCSQNCLEYCFVVFSLPRLYLQI